MQKLRTWFGNEITVKNIEYPTTKCQMIDCLSSYKGNYGLRVFGSTSNVLFPQKKYIGPLIFTTKINESVDFKTGWVSASTLTERLSVIAASRGYSGFEGIEGIPGTVGGAIVMNASAYGCSITDRLIEIEVFDRRLNCVDIIQKKDIKFFERSSQVLEDRKLFLLSARFKFVKGDLNQIRRNRSVFHLARHNYSDYSLPSLGSAFVKVNGNINNDILDHIRKQNSSDINLKMKFFILRLYNSSFMTIVRRGTRWNPYHWIFKKYMQHLMADHDRLNSFTMNSIMNYQDDIEAALEHIERLKLLLPDLKLENEIYYENLHNHSL